MPIRVRIVISRFFLSCMVFSDSWGGDAVRCYRAADSPPPGLRLVYYFFFAGAFAAPALHIEPGIDRLDW
jgi:hypothetical protein